MKCEQCGGTLDLEDSFCKHCGAINKQARQHIEDMAKYQKEFEATKRFVHDQTIGYNRIVTRVVAIAALLLIGLITFIVSFNADGIKRSMRVKQANARYEEYSKILDQYLEDEDFLGFKAFVEGKSIRYYEGPYEAKYARLIRLNNNYGYLFENLYTYLFPTEYTDYFKQSGWVSDNMETFYKSCEDDNVFGDTSKRDFALEERTIENMKRNIQFLLITYGGFTEEEAASLPTLSAGKRTVLLEEKLEARMQEVEEDAE